MVNINFYGGVFGSSGYDVHVRNLAKATYSLNENVSISTQLFDGWERVVDGSVFSMIKNAGKWGDDVVDVAITPPHNWPKLLSNKHKAFYGFCVFEGDRVPACWIDIMARKDVTGVLVPSTHVKEAILKTAEENNINIINKINIIPHGVDETVFKPSPRVKSLDEPFTFFFNKGWAQGARDRSGLPFLLKAFAEEFGNVKGVVLRVKINPVYNQPGWNLEGELRGIGFGQLSNVFFHCGLVSDLELAGMYRDCDVFVMPSLAEGFGLPALEALKCGRPVITTIFGGQTDFVSEENGWLVGGEWCEAFGDLMYEGVHWAAPSVPELRVALRQAYDTRDCPKRVSLGGWCWSDSASKLLGVVDRKD